MSRQPFDPIDEQTKPEEIFDILTARSKVDLTQVDAKIARSLIAAKTLKYLAYDAKSGDSLEKWSEQKVKFGIDPTGADIHLGHLVPIMLLKIFARLGAQIDFVVGDFTAAIGDPSGRSTERKALTAEEINQNFSSYKQQIKPYFDFERYLDRNFTWHQNSQWLAKNYTLADFLKLAQKLSLRELTQREDLRQRINGEGFVSFAEAVYPVLMGLDSAHLKTTIEIGGADQELNFWLGREVQTAYNLPPEIALCTPILKGLSGDGKKMSKSLNNYISLSREPEDIFGLTMSIPDNHIMGWFMAFADFLAKDSHSDENQKIDYTDHFVNEHPLELKKHLAMYLVYLGHGEDQARIERDNYERKFSKKIITDDDYVTVELKESKNIVEALKQAQPDWSKTHIKQLLSSGAVKLMDQTEAVLTENYTVSVGDKLKVGKLAYFKFE